VHRTLHCALSGAPAARAQLPLLLCVVRWFIGQLLCAVRCAPDMHCRLSGAPVSRFKKRPPNSRLSQKPPFLSIPSSSPSLWRSKPPLRRSPHRRQSSGDQVLLSCPPLGEQPYLPLTFPLSILLSSELQSTLCAQFKFLLIPVNPSGGMCSFVSLEYPCRFLAPFGRVSILKWQYVKKPNSPHTTCSVKCPNQQKNAPIEPKIFRHLHNTFSSIFAKFHTNPIYQASISLISLFRAIVSEPSAQIPFYSYKFKPSTHFTHIYPYKPICEVSAQFQIISYLNSNSKPPMALFLVQTPFSRRLTSRSSYLSFYVPYFSVYIFIHISYTYDYVTNMCSPLLSFQ
jgi:hypothetical protein